MMKKTFLYIILLWMAGSVFAQPKNLFDQATQYYAEANYDAAIKNYEEILAQGKTSAEVYFNLANAYFKLDEIGPSIYYYNKALQLAPNDKDVQNNLMFAREKTLDYIEETPKTGWSAFVENLFSFFSYDTWAKLGIGFSVLFLIFGSVYFFSKKSGIKRVFFSLGLLSFLSIIIAVFFAYQQFKIHQSSSFAIVFSPEVEVYAEPNPNSGQAFKLHEGTKVQVLDNFNGFAHIALADESRGWIKEEAIKLL